MKGLLVTEAIHKHLGFPIPRINTVTSRLREAGILPAGAPGLSPDHRAADVLALIIGLASGAALPKVAAAVATYAALTPGGAVLTEAPASIPRQAQDALIAIALEAIEGLPVREVKVEIVQTWPEIELHWTDGAVERFQPAGALSGHWQDGRQRAAVTFSGTAFASVFKELFK